MTIPSVDFPDWNPPRDRAAFRPVATIFTSIAAGDEFEPSYDPVQLDNAVIVQGNLAPGCAVHVGAIGLFGPAQNLRGAINAGVTDARFIIVTNFIGAAVYVDLINASAVTWNALVFVDTVAGVQPDLILPAQLMAITNQIVVPATAEADAIVIGDAGEYTRATVQTTCDQPYTVTIRRSWLDLTGSPAIVSVDELAATAAGAGDTSVDVPVGANGFAVVVSGTGITPGTADVAVRLYRSGGF